MLFCAALLGIVGTLATAIGGFWSAVTIISAMDATTVTTADTAIAGLLYGSLLAPPGALLLAGLVLIGLSAIVAGVAHIRADIRRAVGEPPQPELRSDWPLFKEPERR